MSAAWRGRPEARAGRCGGRRPAHRRAARHGAGAGAAQPVRAGHLRRPAAGDHRQRAAVHRSGPAGDLQHLRAAGGTDRDAAGAAAGPAAGPGQRPGDPVGAVHRAGRGAIAGRGAAGPTEPAAGALHRLRHDHGVADGERGHPAGGAGRAPGAAAGPGRAARRTPGRFRSTRPAPGRTPPARPLSPLAAPGRPATRSADRRPVPRARGPDRVPAPSPVGRCPTDRPAGTQRPAAHSVRHRRPRPIPTDATAGRPGRPPAARAEQPEPADAADPGPRPADEDRAPGPTAARRPGDRADPGRRAGRPSPRSAAPAA